MPQIKGMMGPKIIAEESLSQGTHMNKSHRAANDPLNYVKIQCKIPHSMQYDVGSLSVFNFSEEIDKINPTKYAAILELENQYSDAVNAFKY
jgi:hypothetical protein